MNCQFTVLVQCEIKTFDCKIDLFLLEQRIHSALKKVDRRTISFYSINIYVLIHHAFLAWVAISSDNCLSHISSFLEGKLQFFLKRKCPPVNALCALEFKMSEVSRCLVLHSSSLTFPDLLREKILLEQNVRSESHNKAYWDIANKYYTAQVEMISVPLSSQTQDEFSFQEDVDAWVIHFECFKTTDHLSACQKMLDALGSCDTKILAVDKFESERDRDRTMEWSVENSKGKILLKLCNTLQLQNILRKSILLHYQYKVLFKVCILDLHNDFCTFNTYSACTFYVW